MGLEILDNPHRFNKIVTFAGGLSSTSGGIGALSNGITTDVAVGALTAASILASGTTFQAFAERLLTATFNPTYTPPTASMTSDLASIVESGTTGITLTVNFNRGSINGLTVGGIWQPSTFQDFRAGTVSNYTILGVNNGTTSSLASGAAVVSDGANVYSATLTHNQGPQPLNSKGNSVDSPYPSALSAVTATVTGKRRMFYGADTSGSIPSTSNEIRGLPQNFLNPTNGSTYTQANSRALTIPAGTTRVIIAYPNSLQAITSVKYVEAGNAEVKSTFTETTINVQGTNSYQTTGYRVYYYIPSIPFGSSATYEITI